MLKTAKEGMDSDGKSYYYGILRGQNLRMSQEDMDRYDNNIKGYLDHINKKRIKNINLKYFQYIAILFTEIFLDNVLNRRDDFLGEINNFISQSNSRYGEFSAFVQNDLRKVAYWMATGSGKTLIMHINYLQYRRYVKTDPDNILLITPNASLSGQHLNELQKSDIPAELGAGVKTPNVVQIIEIHTLTEEKTGDGTSIEVSSFEGDNLVFVDEGHRGFTGDKWKKLRGMISEIGFTFEYSATFNEAIKSNKDDLFEEYSKAIIMDYSYSYFYHDGFGKEFHVMNLTDASYEEHKELILLTNIISFYQQLKVFQERGDSLKEFFLDKPLWIFVGNSVARKKESFDSDTFSDLQFTVRFFSKFLRQKSKFARLIKNIIYDRTHLIGRNGSPLSGMFGYLKEHMDVGQIYDDILRCVFNTQNGGRIMLRTISGVEGEVGLGVSGSEKYFGLVYVGNVSSFKKGLGEDGGLEFGEDKFTDSLFDSINNKDSPINILIGAKKFVEGWDSFRVAAMGLLNTGRSRGSQIIQLFGRGVRIRGYNNLMKRSKALAEEHAPDEIPADLHYLETLNIFGMKADYVEAFRNQLKNEEICEDEVLNLNIRTMPDISKNNLNLTTLATEAEFSAVVVVKNMDIMIKIDLRPRIQVYDSGRESIETSDIDGLEIPLQDYLDLLDWDKIYFELYDFKQTKGFYNLYFDKKDIQNIMKRRNYTILADKEFDVAKAKHGFLEQISLRILRKYLVSFYNSCKREWLTENLGYVHLSQSDGNFLDYQIMVDKKETALITEIKELINDVERIYENDSECNSSGS